MIIFFVAILFSLFECQFPIAGFVYFQSNYTTKVNMEGSITMSAGRNWFHYYKLSYISVRTDNDFGNIAKNSVISIQAGKRTDFYTISILPPPIKCIHSTRFANSLRIGMSNKGESMVNNMIDNIKENNNKQLNALLNSDHDIKSKLSTDCLPLEQKIVTLQGEKCRANILNCSYSAGGFNYTTDTINYISFDNKTMLGSDTLISKMNDQGKYIPYISTEIVATSTSYAEFGDDVFVPPKVCSDQR